MAVITVWLQSFPARRTLGIAHTAGWIRCLRSNCWLFDTGLQTETRNFDGLLGCRDEWLLALALAWHIHDLVEALGLCDLNCFLHPLDRGDLSVSAGASTIRSGVCCCTRSLNGWICCSRAAARSACVLPDFVQSGLCSSECSLPLGTVRISLGPGEGG